MADTGITFKVHISDRWIWPIALASIISKRFANWLVGRVMKVELTR